MTVKMTFFVYVLISLFTLNKIVSPFSGDTSFISVQQIPFAAFIELYSVMDRETGNGIVIDIKKILTTFSVCAK